MRKQIPLVAMLCFCALFTVQCINPQTEESGQHSSTQPTAAAVVEAIRAAPSPVADQPTAAINPASAIEASPPANQPDAPVAVVTARDTATTQRPAPNPTDTPTPIATQGPPAAQTPESSFPLSTETTQYATAQSPIIHFFRADVDAADPGDTVTLEWDSSGADRAAIQRVLPSGQLEPTWLDVPPTGSMTYQLPEESGGTVQLYASRSGVENGTDVKMLELTIRCAQEWFFAPAPDGCPDVLRTSNAAKQQFERGTMVWVEEFYWADSPTANNRTIYVLFDNAPSVDGARSSFRTFTDDWGEGQPDFDPEIIAPSGLYQPTRGFGKVWRENAEIRERLGWAVGEEAGFVITMQADDAYKYSHLYLQLNNGRVLDLWPIGQTWAVVK